MAEFDDLSFTDRGFMKLYRYRRSPWKEMARLAKPLRETKGALITTAALHLEDQEPFDEQKRGGDSSYREIPADVEVARLRISHRSRSFDRSGIEKDPNLAFPIDRVRELASAGRIGEVNRRHLSFMGSITAPGRLIRDFAPEAARLLREDGLDVALLVPV